MIGLLIINLLVSVMVVITVVGTGMMIEKHVDESLCELMTAVFNAEEIKERARKAAERGEDAIDI